MNKRQRQLLAALQPAADFALNRPGAHAATVQVCNAGSGTAELMIYGAIGGGSWMEDGITAKAVNAALAEVTAPNLHVRINSGGGDVFDGVAIHSLLARHPATVTTFVDGLAASAASFIAQAGDRIVMARNAMMMIHDAGTGTWGNAAEHRQAADLLEKISDNIADVYAERAGDDVQVWRDRMLTETWYTGQEAVDAGLADEITAPDGEEGERATAHLLRRWGNLLPPEVLTALPGGDRVPPGESGETGVSETGEHVSETPGAAVEEQSLLEQVPADGDGSATDYHRAMHLLAGLLTG